MTKYLVLIPALGIIYFLVVMVLSVLDKIAGLALL